jgi:protein O-mannosyl-transferase
MAVHLPGPAKSERQNAAATQTPTSSSMARAAKRRAARSQSKASREPPRESSPSPSRTLPRLPRLSRWQLFALAVITVLAFGAAFRAPFQFDDVQSIEQNRTIDRLWPPSVPLHPPPGIAVSGRPVVNYSLALNHALNDVLGVVQGEAVAAPNQTVGYHVVNVLIHILNGLLLFGIIRRTMRFGRGASAWTDAADRIALTVAALWLVHPLQTDAVDYVIQRTELLVSTCYLTTLYASIRAGTGRTRGSMLAWYAVAVLACLGGMWSKEVMATAPLVVLLYDRVFRFSSWRDAWRSDGGRPLFYVALFATLIPLAFSIAGGARTATVGFHLGLPWYEYLYSQGWAIAHYLKLVFWPGELTFDYGARAVHVASAVPGLLLVAGLAVATVVAWTRAPWLGFVGTSFFLILAPSSSVIPIRTEVAAERRVYLALALVLVVLVAGAEWLHRRMVNGPERRWRREAGIAVIAAGVTYLVASRWTAVQASRLFGGTFNPIAALIAQVAFGVGAAAVAWLVLSRRDRRWIVAGIVAILAVATAARSALYETPERLWRDAIAKQPTNPRGYDNLAAVVLHADSSRRNEAEGLLRQALSVDSTYASAWTNLAEIEMERGDFGSARGILERALAINPNDVDATARLGGVLVKLGSPREAIPRLEKVVAAFPTDESLALLAQAYLAVGRNDDATSALRRAFALNPNRADAAAYLGALLAEQGRPDEAIGYLEAASRGTADGPVYALLSLTAAQLGRPEEAMAAARRAATLANGDAKVLIQTGRAMMMLQDVAAADGYFARAVQLEPSNLEAITRLGIVKAAAGHEMDAAQLFRRALSIDPTYGPARQALEKVGRSESP